MPTTCPACELPVIAENEIDAHEGDCCLCIAYHGVTVGYNAGRSASKALKAAGYAILEQGESEGSTGWTILLCDCDYEPLTVEQAAGAVTALHNAGFGYVEAVTVNVS